MGMSCCCLGLHTGRTDGSRYSVWWRWNVLSVIHATLRHFKKCKTLVVVDPLNIITADNKYDDCSIRVYRSFTAIFHKCAINVFYIFPIMLVLWLMLSMTNYTQNYAGIIGGSLVITQTRVLYLIYRIAGFCHEDFNVAFHGIRNIKIRYIFIT